MAANSKFRPKVSSNIIEGATPVEETVETLTPDSEQEEVSVETVATVDNEVEAKAPADETVETQEEGATPVEEEETSEDVETKVDSENPDKEEDENSETAPPDPEIKFEDKDSQKSSIEKNVKVCLKVNHSCNIGGVSYHFEKGKQVNVPSSVKTILMQAGLLMPL